MHRRAALALLATALAPRLAAAQAPTGTPAWAPTRPVRLIIPYPPGGGTDTLARPWAERMRQKLGQPLVIENRGGAATNIGMEAAARSPADGHTLAINADNIAYFSFLYRRMPYDLFRDLTPIGYMAETPLVAAINPSVPARTLQEFIALAKAKPNQLHMAHSGIGTFLHTSGVLFAKSAGIQVVPVPFKGAGPAIQNILGGDSQFIMVGMSSLGAFLSSGRLRPLGVASDKRSRYLPDVPTMAEQGLPQVKAANWFGILAPAGTPQTIVQRLHKELAAVQDKPEFRAQVDKIGAEVLKMGPSEFKAFITAELAKWKPVLGDGSIKPE